MVICMLIKLRVGQVEEKGKRNGTTTYFSRYLLFYFLHLIYCRVINCRRTCVYDSVVDNCYIYAIIKREKRVNNISSAISFSPIHLISPLIVNIDSRAFVILQLISDKCVLWDYGEEGKKIDEMGGTTWPVFSVQIISYWIVSSHSWKLISIRNDWKKKLLKWKN